MKGTRLSLPWSLLVGLVLVSTACDALKGNVLVLNKLRAKPDDSPPTSAEDRAATEQQVAAGNGTLAEAEAAAGNSTKTALTLTGIPQIDYVHDPNLPRELNGYNLKDYPFYDRVPEEMDFKCDGLHDGFYASVLHKCQVYHHCLFGTRYDFLCANYTAFDQKTFICHFVSEVDCVNSPKYFNRNEALYKAATTTTAPPPRTTAPPPRRQVEPEVAAAPRRRRPYRRRRPVYEYVYEDEYDDDLEEYEDEALVTQGRSRTQRPAADEPPRRKRPLPQQRPAATQDDFQDPAPLEPSTDLKHKPSSSVYDRPRMPPKIRRPVPLNERDKYDYSKHPSIITTPPNADELHVESNQRPKSPQPPSSRATEDDYYYDEEEYISPSRSTHGQGSSRPKPAPAHDHYPLEGDMERRPPKTGGGVPPRRNHGHASTRKRISSTAVDTATPYPSNHEPDEYDNFYDEVPRRAARPPGGRRRIKGGVREEDDYVRRPVQGSSFKTRTRSQPQRYEPEDYYVDEDPVPATRPAYISRPQSNRDVYSGRRRPQQQTDTTGTDYIPPRTQASPDYKRPAGRKPSAPGRYSTGYAASDAEYYDETEELLEEPQNYRSRPKQPAVPPRPSSGSQYQAAARDEDPVPVSKPRLFTSNSRYSGSNPPVTQQQSSQYSSDKIQPVRNHPATSQDEVEDYPHLQDSQVAREKTTEEDRDKVPTARRNNKFQGSDPELITTPVQLKPKGFTHQSNYKSEDTYLEASPSRPLTSSGGGEYRRRLTSEDSQLPISPSTGPSVISYQSKAIPPGDTLSRTPYGKYQSMSGDIEPISIAPATTERTTETSASSRPITPKDNSSNKTTTDYQLLPSRGGSKQVRPLGKLVLKTAVRDRENVLIVPEDESLRHNIADVADNEDDVARNDVLSPSIPSTRSIPSGPAYLKSGDGQPRFRVKLFKSKLTPQLTSQDNPSQSLPKNKSKDYGSTDVELSSSLAGGGVSGGGDSRGLLVTSASQTQYTRAPFPTHSKDIVLEGSASDKDDHTGRITPVSSASGSFIQRHSDQYSSSSRAPYLDEYIYTPQSRQQVWSQQRKRSSNQYLYPSI